MMRVCGIITDPLRAFNRRIPETVAIVLGMVTEKEC